jgi:uncharacterized low-complexity protein
LLSPRHRRFSPQTNLKEIDVSDTKQTSSRSTKALGLAIGAVVTTGLLTAPAGYAAENPFGMKSLAKGYMVADAEGKCGADKKAHEAKCGEGKCGDKATEAHCGADKTATEAHCGADKKAGEAKCGEGKCGDKKAPEVACGADKKSHEGKCGEGKCGSSMVDDGTAAV